MQRLPASGDNPFGSRYSGWIIGGFLLLLLVLGLRFDLSQPAGRPVRRVDFAGPAPSGALARLGRGAVNVLSFAPDGSQVAVGGQVGIFLYQADSLEEIWAIPAGEPVLSVSFSPDGSVLAAGLKDSTLALLDAEDGFLLNALGGGGEVELQSLAWSPEPVDTEIGYWLAAGFNDGRMILAGVRREAATLAVSVLGSFARSRTGVTAIAFSPNNRILASGTRSGEIFLWDAATLEPLIGLAGHDPNHAVRALRWSADGRQLLSGARDGQVILWDIQTFSPLAVFAGHQAAVLAVAFGPGPGQLISVDQEGALIGWRASGDPAADPSFPAGGPFTAAGWSPRGGRFAAVDETGRLLTWETRPPPWSPAGGRTLTGHEIPSRFAAAVAWSPDGRVLASASGNRILLWDRDTLLPEAVLIRHRSQVTALAWSPDGEWLASGSRDKTVMIWKASTGAHLRTLAGHQKGIADLAWAPGGAFLASTGVLDQSVILWDPVDWQVAGILQDPSSGYASLTWSPDGATLVGGHGSGSLFFWDFSAGIPSRPAHELEGHLSWVVDVAFSPDGGWIASAGADTRVSLWDLDPGRPPQVLAAHQDVVRGVAFHPAGDQLASVSLDRQVVLWDLAEGAAGSPARQLRIGHTDDVLGLAWSPDGALLATGSQDGTVILWEGNTEK